MWRMAQPPLLADDDLATLRRAAMAHTVGGCRSTCAAVPPPCHRRRQRTGLPGWVGPSGRGRCIDTCGFRQAVAAWSDHHAGRRRRHRCRGSEPERLSVSGGSAVPLRRCARTTADGWWAVACPRRRHAHGGDRRDRRRRGDGAPRRQSADARRPWFTTSCSTSPLHIEIDTTTPALVRAVDGCCSARRRDRQHRAARSPRQRRLTPHPWRRPAARRTGYLATVSAPSRQRC